MQTNTNHFAQIQAAILDVSIRNHAFNLVLKTQIKEKATCFQDLTEWAAENKEDIELSIAFHLELAKKKKLLIN